MLQLQQTSQRNQNLIREKRNFASPATAFANNVLPVPGGPTNNAPLGIFAPKSV